MTDDDLDHMFAPHQEAAHEAFLAQIEAGARALHEREIEIARSDEVTREGRKVRSMIVPRYQATMAELERKAAAGEDKRLAAFHRFFADCSAMGLCHLPAERDTVSAYLEALRDSGASAAVLRKEREAIRYIHAELDFPDPTHDILQDAICRDAAQDAKKPRQPNGKH